MVFGCVLIKLLSCRWRGVLESGFVGKWKFGRNNCVKGYIYGGLKDIWGVLVVNNYRWLSIN